jgi:hypothetical protein
LPRALDISQLSLAIAPLGLLVWLDFQIVTSSSARSLANSLEKQWEGSFLQEGTSLQVIRHLISSASSPSAQQRIDQLKNLPL